MKAILEFNLPEDTEEYETTMNAGKMSSFIHEMVNGELRGVTKYGNLTMFDPSNSNKYSEKEVEFIQSIVSSVREYIADKLTENGLDNI